jgi:hypothetical protein
MSAYRSVLENCLTPSTLLEMGIYRQAVARSVVPTIFIFLDIYSGREHRHAAQRGASPESFPCKPILN